MIHNEENYTAYRNINGMTRSSFKLVSLTRTFFYSFSNRNININTVRKISEVFGIRIKLLLAKTFISKAQLNHSQLRGGRQSFGAFRE